MYSNEHIATCIPIIFWIWLTTCSLYVLRFNLKTDHCSHFQPTFFGNTLFLRINHASVSELKSPIMFFKVMLTLSRRWLLWSFFILYPNKRGTQPAHNTLGIDPLRPCKLYNIPKKRLVGLLKRENIYSVLTKSSALIKADTMGVYGHYYSAGEGFGAILEGQSWYLTRGGRVGATSRQLHTNSLDY